MKRSISRSLEQSLKKRADLRQKVARNAGEALKASKQAIFALHRGDDDAASQLMKQVQGLLKTTGTLTKRMPTLKEEGSLRAAREEYAEAQLFAGFLTTRNVVDVRDNNWIDDSMMIAGLCDATGEVLRWATLRAAERDLDDVRAAAEYIESVVAFLVSVDLTGYLRTKADQAKGRLPRIERIVYELSLQS